MPSRDRENRGASLGRGLLLALFAGLGALPFQLLFGVLWDFDSCLGAYLLGCAVLSVLVTAPSLRGALPAGLLALALCGGLALTLPGPTTAILGVVVVLGLARGALLYPRPFARALAFELALALPSAGAFALLHDGHLLGNTLAVWSFWLVQSAFALLPAGTRPVATEAADPFESAAAAAERVMHGS